MTARSPRTLVLLAFVAVSVIWGSTYLAIRVALEGFPPFFGGGVRFLLAGTILYGALRARGVAAPTPVEWRSAAITGVLYFVLGNGLVIVAEQSVSSGLVAVLVATMPLWATLFERFTGARIGRLEWIGIALGLTGVVVLNLGGDLRASGSGALCALVAPMGWASASIVSKRLTLPKGPMCMAAQMLAGGVALTVSSRVLREHIDQAPSARAIGAMLYLVIFGSLVGFTAYVYLLRNTRTSIATSYAFINPVIALGLGVALAGERIERSSALGAVIILAAVVLITRGKGSAATAPAPQSSAKAADPVT
jgi:drug/metabolite transporter (DMT)-like permease